MRFGIPMKPSHDSVFAESHPEARADSLGHRRDRRVPLVSPSDCHRLANSVITADRS
jgi:hypothetical protein